jgi:NADPH-dependent 2,4-dienoyl-CoA reductase/sulfur reductase-like enzyme/rhodanese-related sulfurtransferase
MSTEKPQRIVIIGGVAAGASAATRARRIDPKAEITILEKGPAVSFANCGLPYHLGGEIADRNKLLVATPELFWNRFEIRVRTFQEVVAIERESKMLTIQDTSDPTRTFTQFASTQIGYDKLILAMGAEPVLPPFAIDRGPNVFQLWTLPDMDGILRQIHETKVRRALVVGAGFVGIEVVEQLHRIGIQVDLVERSPTVLNRLDPIFGNMACNILRKENIHPIQGQSVLELKSHERRVHTAVLSDGTNLPTDLVILGVGVRPRTQLAARAGLEVGNSGGLVVNEFMQTSDPSIYAAGDLVEYTHQITHAKTLNPLAGPANRSGRIAGEHAACGHSQPMGGVLGTSIVRVFHSTVGMTGLNEKYLDSQKIPYRTAIVQATDHASYFPGATNMQLKVLYEAPSGRILGAQAIGGNGVDKRIDILATAMTLGGTVYDLAKIDLAYAPPFGSAKDPIHMIAFTAINDLHEQPRLLPPDADLGGYQVVDVRTPKEQSELPLEGATAIPIDELPGRCQELDPDQPTVVVCHSGKRAHVGACRLKASGFSRVYNLTGGMSVRSQVPAS